MLEENKQLYVECASLLPNWKTLTKSELCNLYIDYKSTNDPMADSCLSAIICKFWNMINSGYFKATLVATPEDAYEWVIEAILYALNKHVWLNPESKLYGDPKGPEKAIMVCIKAGRVNYYESASRYKRKLNSEALSLDVLEENSSDGYYLPTFDEDCSISSCVTQYVSAYFNTKDYLAAFTLDALAHNDLFEPCEGEGELSSQFSIRKLKHYLRNLDVNYCRVFATSYALDYNQVLKSLPYVKELTCDRLDRGIRRLFTTLAHDKKFLSSIRGY